LEILEIVGTVEAKLPVSSKREEDVDLASRWEE
jgi:hypothetical protein